jgi:hypothetical protein
MLELGGNNLSGSIPSVLSNLSNLNYLYLYQNQLTGEIPSLLQNLSNLTHFDLSHNQITGKVPVWVVGMTSLEYLDLAHNQLSGTITGQDSVAERIASDGTPLPNLFFLGLNSNRLTGGVPEVLQVLTGLEELYINSNALEGEIPTSLTNLTNLTSADFTYNALYTDDPTLRAFLSSVDSDWEDYQTVAPEDVTLTYVDSTTFELGWTPILYTEDPGGYRVKAGINSGGPYILYDTTIDKGASGMTVTVPSPNQTYYFVVQTRTEPHGNNDNTLDSEFSAEVTSGDKPDINVRYGNKNFADESDTNLGTRPTGLIKGSQFVFTIENLGASPLVLKGVPVVVLYGADAGKFMVSAQPADDTLGVGESTTFTLEADPSWADLPPGSTETVTFGIGMGNNDPDEHPYNFTITVTVQY